MLRGAARQDEVEKGLVEHVVVGEDTERDARRVVGRKDRDTMERWERDEEREDVESEWEAEVESGRGADGRR